MKKIKEALQHARLFIVDRIGYSQSEVLERVAIGKEIDEALAAIEQSSQRIAQLETYISENLHKKAICGCGDSIEPDTGAVCGTCASIEQASQPPAGYKLVPIEPTPDMVRAGEHAPSRRLEETRVPGIYCAMIAAAPENAV